MCQQCRYERDFFRASDLTVFVSGQLVRASLPIKVVVLETASDRQMLYSISGAGEEIQLIAPPFFEVDATVSLDKRHSCGENCLLTKLNVPCFTARIANIDQIWTSNRGQVVLVAGHSGTVPVIIERLSGISVAAIDETEFDNLFVVVAHPRRWKMQSTDPQNRGGSVIQFKRKAN